MRLSVPQSGNRRRDPRKLEQRGFADVFMRVFAAFSLAYSALFAAYGFDLGMEGFAALLVLALSALFVLKVRKNTLLFLLSSFIAYANYSAYVANHSGSYAALSSYDSMYAGTSIAAEGTFIMLAFMSAVVLLLPRSVSASADSGLRARYHGRHAVPVVCGISIVLLVILFTCSSGFIYTGRRGTANQLFEYSYILFIVGFYFAGESRKLQAPLLVTLALFVLQSVLSGNRASILALVFLAYALYFADRMTVRQLLPLIALGVLVFLLIGFFRQDTVRSIGKMGDALGRLLDQGFVWDTSSFAYLQSLSIVRLLHYVDPSKVGYLTGQWFASIFAGASLVPDSSLPQYAQRFFPGMGGGYTPFYFYFYFGPAGAVGTGVAVGFVTRLVNRVDPEMGDVEAMLALSLFSTVGRWYLYSPMPLTRGVLLLLVVGWITVLLSKYGESAQRRDRAVTRRSARLERKAADIQTDVVV